MGDDENGLMPQGGAEGGASGSSALSAAESLFDDLSMRKGLLDKIMKGLVGLVEKGDTVGQEDVTKVAGKLVAGGLKPQAMASLLAQMPTQPEMLAKWVGNLAQMAQAREVELNQQLTLARHNMMTKALGTLIQTPSMGQALQATPAPNALLEGGGSAPELSNALG